MAVRELTQRASSINMADLARQDESDRVARYSRAWDAYDGEGPLPFDDEDGQAKDNVRLDYPRLIVDKTVSFLAGKGGVEFQVDPVTEEDEPAGDPDDPEAAGREGLSDDALAAARDAARAALDAAWPEERRHIDFHGLATNGAVCGHAWLRLHEDGRISVLDPATVTAVWSEDDIGILLRYLIEWNAIDADGLGCVRRKRIEPDMPESPSAWTIYDEELDDETGEWVELEDGETAWPRTYPPVLGTQNLPAPNTFYGMPDLSKSVLDLIEQLESVASDMRRIVRLHGHPIPVVTGADADKVQEIDVAIGELLAIPGDQVKFTQLQVAELTSSLALYKELKSALFEAVHVPRVALGDRDKSGATTGVALQIEYAPLVELTETKRLMYGALLRKAAECVLDLRGLPGWRVTLGWPQLLPSDDKAASEATEADLRMGIVSLETAAEKRGYDWSVERERIAEEARDAQARFDAGPPADDDPLPDLPDPTPDPEEG